MPAEKPIDIINTLPQRQRSLYFKFQDTPPYGQQAIKYALTTYRPVDTGEIASFINIHEYDVDYVQLNEAIGMLEHEAMLVLERTGGTTSKRLRVKVPKDNIPLYNGLSDKGLIFVEDPPPEEEVGVFATNHFSFRLRRAVIKGDEEALTLLGRLSQLDIHSEEDIQQLVANARKADHMVAVFRRRVITGKELREYKTVRRKNLQLLQLAAITLGLRKDDEVNQELQEEIDKVL